MTAPQTTVARPRSPGFVYAALSLVMLLVVTILALTSRQDAPPSIAELAPQAQEQIKEAPDEQSSAFGSGEGGEGGEGGGTTTTTTAPPPDPGAPPTTPPPVIDEPRVRRCVGNPPRQTEDPQSPPCVAYWAGDNGGSTYKGVTGNEIRIAVPRYDQMPAKILEAYFNRRFEFYGRKLVLIDTSGERGETESEKQLSAAVSADVEHKVFASLDADDGFYYYRELARRKVVSVVGQPLFSEPELARMHPFVWQYPMTADEMLRTTGDWACSRLAGRNATFAGANGANQMSSETRKIGAVLYVEFPEDKAIALDPFERELSRCGATVVERAQGDDFFSADQAQEAVLRMQQAGITTIFCFCHTIQAGLLYKAASRQLYQPEWILATYLMTDNNGSLQTFSAQPDQLENTFGLTFAPRQLRIEDTPVRQAIKEQDPSAGADYTSLDLFFLLYRYRALLLLASGIQMAGPNLNPDTFAAGLRKARFPNPDTFHKAGSVGFEDGDHSMTDDAAEWWWSNTARSPYRDGAAGTICYVDGGNRRRRGGFTTPDRLFAPPCDSGA